MSRSNEFDTYLRETRQRNHFLHSFDHFFIGKRTWNKWILGHVPNLMREGKSHLFRNDIPATYMLIRKWCVTK